MKIERGSIDLARRLCFEIAGPTDEEDGADYGSIEVAEILSAEVVRLRAMMESSSPGLSPFDYSRLVQWMSDQSRKPANIAFTAGPARDAARAFEEHKPSTSPGVIRITTQAGMVNIDGKDIAYSNIRGMYKTGAGHGLQLNENIEYKRGEIIDICGIIADEIYKLQDLLLGCGQLQKNETKRDKV